MIEDLRDVLTRISVRSGANGPQGPVTQYLLARAAQHLSGQLTGDVAGTADREPVPRVLSALLGHEPFVENVLDMSVHQMRRRWPLATDWYADLVAYVLRPSRWRANHVALLAEFEAWLSRPMGDFLRLMGNHQLRACGEPELFRLGDMLSDLWPDYPPVIRARGIEHRWRMKRWPPVYTLLLEHYGLRIRESANVDVLAWAVATLVTMESRFRPAGPEPAGRAPTDEPTTWSAEAALLLIAGATENIDGSHPAIAELRDREPVGDRDHVQTRLRAFAAELA